jgi:hypothetical protein
MNREVPLISKEVLKCRTQKIRIADGAELGDLHYIKPIYPCLNFGPKFPHCVKAKINAHEGGLKGKRIRGIRGAKKSLG